MSPNAQTDPGFGSKTKPGITTGGNYPAPPPGGAAPPSPNPGPRDPHLIPDASTLTRVETSGTHSLGVWRQEPDQKGFDIQEVVEISAAGFEGYLQAIATFRALSERSTYELLQRHWHRLTSMRHFYANVERVGGSFRAIDKRITAVTFMGEVANWLTTARMYLVSELDSISRTSRDGSKALKRYQSVCSEVFDSNAGYRFLYNLRDYAQHCGPPLGGLIIKATGNMNRTVELYISRSDLLMAHFDWSKHARLLIERWPEQILLFPLLEEAMGGFRRIEDEILRILRERCTVALPAMQQGIARVSHVPGHPAIFRLPDSEPTNISWQSFPDISSLESLELALARPDPLAALRPAPVNPTAGRPIEMMHGEAQAAAVVGTWLEHGPGTVFDQTIDRVLQEDGEIGPLLSGLVNLTAYLSAMLAKSLGSSSESLLGSFVVDRDATSPVK